MGPFPWLLFRNMRVVSQTTTRRDAKEDSDFTGTIMQEMMWLLINLVRSPQRSCLVLDFVK